MSLSVIVLLGAIAGFTIFLGLPFARLKKVAPWVKGLLAMLATGVLLYLLVDVTAKMVEPIGEALSTDGKAVDLSMGLLSIFLMLAGLFLGLIGIVTLTGRLTKHKPENGVSHEIGPETLSLIIAIGIGAHNLSEGLAIGQSAASGSLHLAWLLIVGFGLHNMTEGFGIAGPLSGKPVSWKFLGLLGLIGGGPTFLGTILGIGFHSTPLFVFSLAFAAGAIIYVVMELLGSARKYSRLVTVWGLFIGFLLGLTTDLLLTVAGA
ncbi:MAG: ZIP family metal transporter [Spirochaetales bacterium]|nr:ZIP family metal transporter [Spirochaetales bacterium]